MPLQCPNCHSPNVRNWYRAYLVLALILAIGVAVVMAWIVLMLFISPVLAGDTSAQTVGLAGASLMLCLVGLTPAAVLFRLNRRWYRCMACGLMFQLR
ncbi:MAG: hypothetical protein H0T73_03410 [Ardenticatenales bacterium]|nr:hypothetical protein [Ardenticatenales bacterium]